MSGGIAVLADDLGRRLGKKRLHFRGIRPKRVAQIGTFLAGIIVSLMTIAIVSVASSGVRKWLLEGAHAIEDRNQAIRDRDQVRADLQKALGDVQSAAERAKQAKTRNDQLTSKNTELDAAVREKSSQIDRQTGELARLNGEIARLNPRIAELQARVSSADAKVSASDRKLADRQKRLASVQTRLTNVETLLDKATEQKKDVDDRNLELYAENSELVKTRESLTKDKSELQDQLKTLNEARDQAQGDLLKAKRDLSQAQENLSNLTRQLAVTQSMLTGVGVSLDRYKDITQTARIAPLIYHRGEEVARIPIGEGLSVKSAEAALVSLLRSSRLAALKEGAKPGDHVPEAGIFDHYDNDGQPIRAEDITRSIINRIAGSSEPLVLVAYSTINTFKGEPVSLEVIWYPNPLIYRRGDVVAEIRIDGRKDPSTIFHQLNDLGTQVRDKAKKDKMVARVGSDELYGEVSSEDILKLVGDVKASDRSVRVRAVADADIRAGDPLRLSFIIR